MRKVTLASEGSWAKIRDAKELTVGGQRRIQQAVSRVSPETREILQRNEKRPKGSREEINPSAADVQAFNDANDACVLALVTEWSFDYAVNIEGLQEIPLQDYAKLQAICAPAVRSASVDFSPSEDNQEDPNSPFGNSNGSNGRSEAESSTVAFPSMNSVSTSS